MAEYDEAVDALRENIAFLEAGVHVPDSKWSAEAAKGKAQNTKNKPPPPTPPTP